MRRLRLVAVVALLTLGLAVTGSAVAQQSTAQQQATAQHQTTTDQLAKKKKKKTYKATVIMTEYHFKLSRSKFPAGSTVIFKVKNKGDLLHDFYITNVGHTKLVKSGKTVKLKVKFKKKGTYQYVCTVGEHAERGMIGKIKVTK